MAILLSGAALTMFSLVVLLHWRLRVKTHRLAAIERRRALAWEEESRILERIAAGQSLDTVARQALRMVCRQIDDLSCAVVFRDGVTDRYSVLAAENFGVPISGALKEALSAATEDAIARCMTGETSRGVQEIDAGDPLHSRLREAAAGPGLFRVWLKPFSSVSGQSQGALVGVGWDDASKNVEMQRRLIESAADLIAIANDQSRTDETQRRIIEQQQFLLDLARSGTGDLSEFLEKLTRSHSEVIEVARVGVWLFSEHHSEVRCLKMYRAETDDYEEGTALRAADYPAYFQALNESRTIDARDARSDPRTREFASDYLAPNGITSMLDVPIRVVGRLVGIVCHEHVGAIREWTLHEQEFAASVADMVGMAIESTERRRAEQALRDSEHRFRQLAENIDETFWLYDLRMQSHVYVSPAYEVMWGRSLEDIFENPEDWIEAVHPNDRAKEIERFERQRRGEPSESEYRIVRPDGEVRWVHDRGFAIFDEQGEVTRLAGLVEDITERRRAQAELVYRLDFEMLISRISTRFINLHPDEIDEAIEEALGAIGRFMRVGRGYVFLFDDARERATNTHEWCAEGVTSHKKELIDLARAEAPRLLDDLASGRAISIRSIEDLPQSATVERRILEQQNIKSLAAVPMISRGKTIGFLGFDAVAKPRIWAEDKIALLRLVGEMLTSAIQRHRMESALRDSEGILRSFFDASPMAIGVVDIVNEDDIYFVDANREVADFLKLPLKSVVGRTAREIGISESGNQFWHERYIAAARKGGNVAFEFQRENDDCWYEAVVCPINLDSGKVPDRFAFIFWDVTERKTNEERLRLLNRELNHRVKNNLAVVAALAERSAAKAEDLESFRRVFSGRIQAMSRAHSLIAESEWKAAPLHILLERLLEDFADDVDEDRGVIIDGPPVALSAKEASSMSLIIRELIINAAKHGALSTASGRVEIRWRIESGDDESILRFSWIERDGPTIGKPSRAGFGGDLIDRLVRFDLGGTMEMRFEPAGFQSDIVFPIRAASETETDYAKRSYTGAPVDF